LQAGTRILLFSYGSGLAATLFSVTVRETAGKFSLPRIADLLDIDARFEARTTVSAYFMQRRMGGPRHRSRMLQQDLNVLPPLLTCKLAS
jgi:3-hydroxy-3-methylglutaryl CoA synthase